MMKKLKCPHCGFIKVLGGRELRKWRKRLPGFTCAKCGEKVSSHDLVKKRGKGPKPPGERKKRVKKEVVKERPKPIVPQPHVERPEWRPKPPQPMERTLEEAVISSRNIRVSAPIPTPSFEVYESKFETEKLDRHEKPGETVHRRKSPFETKSDRIVQYLSGLGRALTSKEVAKGLGVTTSFAYNTLQLMMVFGTVQRVKRGMRHYYFLKGVYNDEQISAMLPPEGVKRIPVRESILDVHLPARRTQASSGGGLSALTMIGLPEQEMIKEEVLTEELPAELARKKELSRELDMNLHLGFKFLFSGLKIDSFATVEHLPKDARRLNRVHTTRLKEQLKRLDGYDRIKGFGTVFGEFSALRNGSYGNVFYFSVSTNPWERVYRVMMDDTITLEMKEPVRKVRAWGRSKYDPIIDQFIECGHDLVEISVKGKNPYYIAFQLRRRIKDRGLKIVASSVGGSVYLENNKELETGIHILEEEDSK